MINHENYLNGWHHKHLHHLLLNLQHPQQQNLLTHEIHLIIALQQRATNDQVSLKNRSIFFFN